MIARLTGTIDTIDRDRAIIDVGGVGYLVRASSRTLGALTTGGSARLLVETVMREDAIELYAFATAEERDWFRLLTTVQGVGMKVALSLLSSLSPAELGRAIAAGDRAISSLGRIDLADTGWANVGAASFATNFVNSMTAVTPTPTPTPTPGTTTAAVTVSAAGSVTETATVTVTPALRCEPFAGAASGVTPRRGACAGRCPRPPDAPASRGPAVPS